MDLQHRMAEWIARKILQGAENEEDELLTIFGIEVVINEVIKFIIVMFIALILGVQVLFLSAVLLVLRRIGGGGHCKTNRACFLILPKNTKPLVANNYIFNKIALGLILISGCVAFIICKNHIHISNC